MAQKGTLKLFELVFTCPAEPNGVPGSGPRFFLLKELSFFGTSEGQFSVQAVQMEALGESGGAELRVSLEAFGVSDMQQQQKQGHIYLEVLQYAVDVMQFLKFCFEFLTLPFAVLQFQVEVFSLPRGVGWRRRRPGQAGARLVSDTRFVTKECQNPTDGLQCKVFFR